MRRESGFTLIEALVALVVGGIALTGLSVVTRDWLGIWQRGASEVAQAQEISLALARIGEDIAAAIAPDDAPMIAGDESGFRLARRAPSMAPLPGLEAVRIAQGDTLARSRALLLPGRAPVYGDASTLLRRPLRARFAYAGEAGAFLPRWTEARPPSRIRIAVIDARGSTVVPPFTIAVLPALPVRCAAARGIGDCKREGAP